MKIRGQVQTDSLFTLDPSVGVYVDDIYMARAYGVLSEMLDISGAEVLKGPQGTLFGRNTTGGAIRLTTAKAETDRLGGSVKLTYGNYDTLGMQLMANVPIVTDVLAIRYAGAMNKHDGYTKAYVVPRGSSTPAKVIDTDDRDAVTQRLSLTFTPGQRFRLELSGEMLDANDNGTVYINQAGDITTSGTTWTFSPEQQTDFYSVRTDAIPFAKLKTRSFRAAASYDLTDEITAKAIYGHRYSKSIAAFNNDGNVLAPTSGQSFPGSISQNPTALDQRAKQDSVELQLLGDSFDGRLDWIIGGFWFKETGFDFQNLQVQADALTPIPYSEGDPSIRFYRRGDGVNKSKSVFAHVGFDITDRLTISGGLRYTKDDKSLVGDTRFPTANGNGCAFTNSPPVSVNDGTICQLTTLTKSDFVSWAADLSYKVSDNLFLYVKGANGYRSGGGQARMLDNATSTPFLPETVLEFEGGFKAKMFDRRVTLNVAAYHSKRDDIQFSDTLFATTPFGARATTFLLNSGTGKINGIEGELHIRLPAGFSIEGSASYFKEKRSKAKLPSRNPANPDMLYDVVGQSPFNASASLVYDRDFGFGNVNLRADYIHVPEHLHRQYAVQLTSPFAIIKAYDLVNARAGVTLNNGVSVAVYAKNLLGNEYYRSGFSIGSLYPAAFGDPRTYGVEIGYRF